MQMQAMPDLSKLNEFLRMFAMFQAAQKRGMGQTPLPPQREIPQLPMGQSPDRGIQQMLRMFSGTPGLMKRPDETETFDGAEQESDKTTETKEPVRSDELKELDKFWGGRFKDLTETIYIVMKDGETFDINSQSGKRVSLNIDSLDKYLKGVKGKKYSVKEIDTVIHNHFNRPKFSSSDKNQYMRFKKYGFTGKFLMYNHMRKQVYEYKEEEKKKEGK